MGREERLALRIGIAVLALLAIFTTIRDLIEIH